jgi:hypothetical protein
MVDGVIAIEEDVSPLVQEVVSFVSSCNPERPSCPPEETLSQIRALSLESRKRLAGMLSGEEKFLIYIRNLDRYLVPQAAWRHYS